MGWLSDWLASLEAGDDEYDAAQERGEIAKIGDNLPRITKQNSKPTAADIGLSSKDIHEARIIRDARKPKPEIKSLWFQTSSPRDGDLGRVEAAYYSVADGVLTMRGENGKPTGKTYRLEPGDDERATAGRLAKQAWASGKSDFNRPLHYSGGPSIA